MDALRLLGHDVDFSFDCDGLVMEVEPYIDTHAAEMQSLEKAHRLMAPRGIPASAKEILKTRGSYNLRTGINRENFNGDGWDDQDNTGSFIPETPTRTNARRERRAQRAKARINGHSLGIQSPRFGHHVLPSVEDPFTDFGWNEQQPPHLEPPKPQEDVDTVSLPDPFTEAVVDDSTNMDLTVHAQCTSQSEDLSTFIQTEETQSEQVGESSAPAHPEETSPSVSLATPGETHFVTTSHVHPIIFNYRPPTVSEDPSQKHVGQCHFCVGNKEWSGEFYSIFGHPARRVEVLELYDGKGKTEINGGYAAEGKERTRMCIQCTWARMRITSCDCDRHEIRHMEGNSQEGFDYEAPFLTLVKQIGNVEHQEQLQYKWCSLCPNVAFFECCAGQKFTGDGHPLATANDTGCGLLLCDSCADIMTEGCQPAFTPVPAGQLRRGVPSTNGLDRTMRLARRDRKRYQDGLRADSCFLTMNSELSWRALKGFGTALGSMGERREASLVRIVRAGGNTPDDMDLERMSQGRDSACEMVLEH